MKLLPGPLRRRGKNGAEDDDRDRTVPQVGNGRQWREGRTLEDAEQAEQREQDEKIDPDREHEARHPPGRRSLLEGAEAAIGAGGQGRRAS